MNADERGSDLRSSAFIRGYRNAVGPGDEVVGLTVNLAAQLEFATESFNLRDVLLHLFAVLDQILSLTSIVNKLPDLRARLFVSELDLERGLVRVVPERASQQVRPDPRLVVDQFGRQQNGVMRARVFGLGAGVGV